MITNSTEIYAVNSDTLTNEGWKLKEDKVFLEGTTAFQIYERSISWKCAQALQGNWDNFFSNKNEERKVEVKQNHPLDKLHADIFMIIVKSLSPLDIFHFATVDKKLGLFLQKDTKDLNEIKLALIQARDFREFVAKQMQGKYSFDDSIQAYQKYEKLDELSYRIGNLFYRYNIYNGYSKKIELGKFFTIDLEIKYNPSLKEKRSASEILENLHMLRHHTVKLYTDLSKLSKASILQYLENCKIEDPVFKLKIKCFLENFEGNFDEIKSLFSEHLKGNERYQLTELIKLLSIINHNAAEECFKKNIDYLLNLEDDYMLLDKELIKFFLNEDIIDESCHNKYNLKDPNDEVYTTSPVDAMKEFFNYIKENDFKSEEEFKVILEADNEFAKSWKTGLDFMTISLLMSQFHEMIAIRPHVLLNRFKEKIDFVGLNSDYFLFNMVKAANNFPTAMRIVNLIDDPDGKLQAFDLALYDYSILKPK